MAKPAASISARVAVACDVCKRRKEKCNGLRPCGRCVKRRVEWQCHFTTRPPAPHLSRPGTTAQISEYTGITANEDITLDRGDESTPKDDSVPLAPIPRLSRLIRHPNRKLIYLGDHSNSSFLHSVRRIVQNRVGHCAFIDDPHRNRLVDGIEIAPLGWLQQGQTTLVPKPEHEIGQQLLDSFLWVTDGLLDLLDREEVEKQIPEWLRRAPDMDSVSAKYYLVLALGAQSSTRVSDDLAESLFRAGRYLSMVHFMDKPSLSGVQCFLLITMFLITASRRNAASMNLGVAIHAGYAIGLHQGEVSELFKKEEQQAREKTWKSMRMLDVFLGGSLGRPLATVETRPVFEEKIAAAVSLCWITEYILQKVYLPKLVPIAVVNDISRLHRKWVSLLPREKPRARAAHSPTTNSIPQLELGNLHLNTEYHVSIMLLTRPFLLDMALRSANEDDIDDQLAQMNSHNIPYEKAFGIACVDSATKIVDLARQLLQAERAPKRLPYIVNATFLAGLSIGLAFFANLRQQFPLHECLGDALKVLQIFAKSDIVAQRGLSLLTNLESACRMYVSKCDIERYEVRTRLVADLFGEFQASNSTTQQQPSYLQNKRRTATIRQDSQNTSSNTWAETPDRSDQTVIVEMQEQLPAVNSCETVISTPEELATQQFHDDLPQTVQAEVLMDANVYLHQSGPWFAPLEGDSASYINQFWDGQNMFSLD